MRYLSMEIMIQHIKICICFLFSVFASCKQVNDRVVISDGNMSKQLEAITSSQDNYQVWYHSSKNKLVKYVDFQFFVGKDSMKVINAKTGEIVCFGEIIKENKTFSSYIKSEKNADVIKSELKSLFNIDIKGNVQVIQNSKSDISKKGCQFPFYEVFITNDLLIFYDEGYHVFSKNIENEISQNTPVKEYKIVQLPFDFSDYYNLCYSDDEKCKQRYPSYTASESDDILSYFGIIEETPTEIFMLSPYNGFQPLIIAYTDSDVEGYYLFVAKQRKVISSLQIGKMDGVSIEDFIITKKQEVEIYSRKDAYERRNLIRKYKINQNGVIEKF